MRELNREIVVMAEQTHEDIVVILENKLDMKIDLTVHLYRADESLINPEYYTIDGENYNLLMSADPEFAPGKPENEYREVDLFHLIDKIRNA